MAQVDLLKRERIVRMAAVLFMLSPFANIAMTFVSETSALHARWTPRTFGAVMASQPFILCFLWAASLCTGLMMYKGRRASWISVLAILFFFIGYNLMTFSSDIKDGWFQPTLALAINIGLFALIYSLEFHQMAQAAALAKLRSIRFVKADGPVVEFSAVGKWAQVIAITPQHISMRATGPAPPGIQTRAVVITFTDKVVVKARFVQAVENAGKHDYYFEYTDLGGLKPAEFEEWVKRRNTGSLPQPAAGEQTRAS